MDKVDARRSAIKLGLPPPSIEDSDEEADPQDAEADAAAEGDAPTSGNAVGGSQAGAP